MQAQCWICPDCKDDHGPGECPPDKYFKYLIEDGWFCWDCAENTGGSFIQRLVQLTEQDDFHCDGCKGRFTG